MTEGSSTFGQRVRLTRSQRKRVRKLQRLEGVNGLAARRARVLELLDDGWRQCDVANATGAGIATVGRVRRRFLEDGFDAAIQGKKPPGAARLLQPAQEAKIVALACSDPPAGRATWTTELLAQMAVEKGLVCKVGRETVRLVLKHHGLKPWREKIHDLRSEEAMAACVATTSIVAKAPPISFVLLSDIDVLRRHVGAWQRAANRHRRTIHWGFTVRKARKKLGYKKQHDSGG